MPFRYSSCYGPRNLAQGRSYGRVTYIATVLYPVLCSASVEDLWALDQLPPFFLPVAVCFTINISSFSPCVKSYVMTMGDFHGNLASATMLDLELLAPLTNYKHPLVPPVISRPPLPRCPVVFRLSTSRWAPHPLVTACNIQLGTWRLTAFRVSCLTLYILRDPKRFQFVPIMDKWD